MQLRDESMEPKMQGRYPRTVREFAENNRIVLVYCGECQHRRTAPADVLEAMWGPDFDLYDGFAALEEELRCEACGKKHRTIIFRKDELPQIGRKVSFEDALNKELERRAYIRARGEESTAVRGWVRRRR